MVRQRRFGAHVTVLGLAAVHTRVPGKGLELLNGRARLIIQVADLDRRRFVYFFTVIQQKRLKHLSANVREPETGNCCVLHFGLKTAVN